MQRLSDKKIKITEKQLRRLIRQELLKEAGITVGDIKSALKHASDQKLKKVTRDVGKSALVGGAKIAANFFTGGIAGELIDIVDKVKDAKEVGGPLVGALFPKLFKSSPQDKESHPIWDRLTIDPETATVIDDSVEENFLKDLEAQVAKLPDDTVLPDADEQLASWMKRKFKGTHVSKGS